MTRIVKTIEQAGTEGRLGLGGFDPDQATDGYFIGPQIFADVLPTAAIAQQERPKE